VSPANWPTRSADIPSTIRLFQVKILIFIEKRLAGPRINKVRMIAEQDRLAPGDYLQIALLRNDPFFLILPLANKSIIKAFQP
jgi:hypothetical protein